MVRQFSVTFTVSMSLALTLLSGCGKSESGPEAAAAAGAAPSASPATASQPADVAAAMDTVGHFLDAVRRGGDTGGAHSLLTRQASSVLEGLGRTVQPIGSPDAAFTVTRSEAVEGHPNMALVHSTWSEPLGDGTTDSYQVVWALQHEDNAWKISGLAMELDPQQPPLIVDFEDHVEMANLFREQSAASPESTANATPSASAEPQTSVSQTPPTNGQF